MRPQLIRRRVYSATLAAKGLAEELAERNRAALTNWRIKIILKFQYPDALSPVSRALTYRWLAEQADLAKRWQFKMRCTKRNFLRNTDWAKLARVYRS